jgi:hypothetical protein
VGASERDEWLRAAWRALTGRRYHHHQPSGCTDNPGYTVGTGDTMAAVKPATLGFPRMRSFVVLALMLFSKRSLGPFYETTNYSSVPLVEPSSEGVSSSPPALPTSVTCDASDAGSSSDPVKAWQALGTSKASRSRTTRAATILLATYTRRPGRPSPRGLRPLCIHFLSPPLPVVAEPLLAQRTAGIFCCQSTAKQHEYM